MRIKFYRKRSGGSPIQKYVDARPIIERTKCLGVFAVVGHYGRNSDQRFLKKLHGQGLLWEIRVTTQREHRFLCTIDQGCILVMHAFIKKSQKTPLKELAVAQKRLKEYLQ